eukprot:c20559_g1_i2.p1 GENE.c20559_g1_i2~~c20559_g1_i2.p1  ORF type:complete len:802 (+),score=165.47 c20559_g1_i2:36-2441(+)
MAECPVCTNAFDCGARWPRVLRCGHTFCSTCLKEVLSPTSSANDGGPYAMECPFDRIETSLDFHNSAKGILVDQLPSNLEFVALVQNASDSTTMAQHLCQVCDDEDDGVERHFATHWCAVCREYMCHKKSGAHARRPATQNHTVVTIAQHEEYTAENQSASSLSSNALLYGCRLACEDHRGILTLFDSECKRLVCKDCVLFGAHKGHAYRAVVEVADELVRESKQSGWVKTGEAHLTALQQAERTVEQIKTQLEENCDITEASIHSLFDQLREALKSQEAELVAQTKNLRKRKSFALVDQQSCLRAVFASTQRALEVARLLASPEPHTRPTDAESTAAQVIELGSQVRSIFSQNHSSLRPVEDSHARLEVAPDFTNKFLEFLRQAVVVSGDGPNEIPQNIHDSAPAPNTDVADPVANDQTTKGSAIDQAMALAYGLNRSKVDLAAAFKVLDRPVQAGDAVANALAAEIRFRMARSSVAKGVKRLLGKALRSGLLREAEAGSGLAQALLGFAYDPRIGMNCADKNTALNWFKKSAEQNHPLGQSQLGSLYFNEFNDKASALHWTTLAAEQGHAVAQKQGYDEAQCSLGKAYEFGCDGDVENLELAEVWYTKAAEQGNTEAQASLQRVHEKNISRPEFIKAAEAGDDGAQYDLGVRYENGIGIGADMARALHWYTKSGEQGNTDALYNLGVIYATGRGVEKDEALAVGWYSKAAELGHAVAQFKLGVMYANGLGVSQDYNKAIFWYEKSAEQNNAIALYNLAWMYDKGCGVRKNLPRAMELYRCAADLGHDKSRSRIRNAKRR